MDKNDIEKNWDDFHREPVTKSTLGGEMEGLSAQVNNVEAKLDQVIAKIGNTGGAEGELPPAEGGMPPAEGGMPPGMEEAMGGEMPPADGGMHAGDEQMDEINDSGPMSSMNGPLTPDDIGAMMGGGQNPEQQSSSVDKTLAALQGAIATADDPEVIAHLSEIILDYTDKMNMEEQQMMAAAQEQAAAEQPSEDEITQILPMIAQLTGGQPEGADMDLMSAMASEHSDVFAEFTSVIKSKCDEGAKMSMEEVFEPLKRKFPEKEGDEKKEEKKEEGSEEEKKEEKSEEKKSDIPEKKKDDEMEVEIAVAASPDMSPMSASPEPVADTPKADPMKVEEIMAMPMKDIIDLAVSACGCKEEDPNSFISGKTPTDPIIACDGTQQFQSLNKSEDYDLDDTFLVLNGVKKSKADEAADETFALVKSMSSKDDVSKMTVGQVFNNIASLKKSGVTDVERRCADAIDLISRFTDANMGGADATDVLMCSMGVNMDVVFEKDNSKTETLSKSVMMPERDRIRKYIRPLRDYSDEMNEALMQSYINPNVQVPSDIRKAIDDIDNYNINAVKEMVNPQASKPKIVFIGGKPVNLNAPKADLNNRIYGSFLKKFYPQVYDDKGVFNEGIYGSEENFGAGRIADMLKFMRQYATRYVPSKTQKGSFENQYGLRTGSEGNMDDFIEKTKVDDYGKQYLYLTHMLGIRPEDISYLPPAVGKKGVIDWNNRIDSDVNNLKNYRPMFPIPFTDKKDENGEVVMNGWGKAAQTTRMDAKPMDDLAMDYFIQALGLEDAFDKAGLFKNYEKGEDGLEDIGNVSEYARRPLMRYAFRSIIDDPDVKGFGAKRAVPYERVVEDNSSSDYGQSAAEYLNSNAEKKIEKGLNYYPDSKEMTDIAFALEDGTYDVKSPEYKAFQKIMGDEEKVKGIVKDARSNYAKKRLSDSKKKEAGNGVKASMTQGKELGPLNVNFSSVKKSADEPVYKSPSFAASGQTVIGDIEAVMRSNQEFDLDAEIDKMSRIKTQQVI